jgi:alpha-tubulin suppressor-like RCC1 family protein
MFILVVTIIIINLVPTQLSVKTGLSRILSAHCEANNTILCDVDNNLWGFGSNNYKQLQLCCGAVALGLRCNDDIRVPTKLSFDDKTHSIISFGDSKIIINTEGDCLSFGNNCYERLGLGHNTKITGLKANISHDRMSGNTKNARNCF